MAAPRSRRNSSISVGITSFHSFGKPSHSASEHFAQSRITTAFSLPRNSSTWERWKSASRAVQTPVASKSSNQISTSTLVRPAAENSSTIRPINHALAFSTTSSRSLMASASGFSPHLPCIPSLINFLPFLLHPASYDSKQSPCSCDQVGRSQVAEGTYQPFLPAFGWLITQWANAHGFLRARKSYS